VALRFFRGLILNSLSSLTQAQVEHWSQQAKVVALMGQLPDYIPQLAEVDGESFAVQVQTLGGEVLTAGGGGDRFVLMSVVKPFLLLYLLERWGEEAVFRLVGRMPSDLPFHSLSQLASDRAFPRNPMINSGAILLAANLGEVEGFRSWLNGLAGCDLRLDRGMLESVKSLPNESNRAIAMMLCQAGQIGDVSGALESYNHLCCMSATVGDLANLGMLLVRPHDRIKRQHQRMVTALMLTCGLYEASSDWAVRVGVPVKSGVSGAMLAVVPGQGAIGLYGPAIDGTGNSVAGIYFLEQAAEQAGLSIF
jgi:glutaminase